jgi:hypothetical protein
MNSIMDPFRTEPSNAYFDKGHQGEVDWPQIQTCLRLTPTERLRRHEGWRLFMRRALKDAELRRADDHRPGARVG